MGLLRRLFLNKRFYLLLFTGINLILTIINISIFIKINPSKITPQEISFTTKTFSKQGEFPEIETIIKASAKYYKQGETPEIDIPPGIRPDDIKEIP